MEENKITNTNATPPPHPSQASAPTPPPPPQQQTPQPSEPTQCVNKGRPVWFSYAPNSDEKPEWSHIADCVEQLTAIFKEQNIEYCINDTAETSANISDYEQHIGWDSDVIVLVFSDKYFRSLHCMYEFVQIKKAIKEYPQKRLFCIKSGDFNLSDINYILDLEHFWGDQKQEYDEVSYHNTRPITGAEEEAHGNDFYMADIRSLYSFFSSLNYANASSKDWNEFAKEISSSYTSASKFTKQMMEKVSSRKTTLKFMGIGCITWLIVPFLIVCITFVVWVCYLVGVENPKYSKGPDNMVITEVKFEPLFTTFNLKLNNPNDKDTIIFASRGYYLEADGKQYYLWDTEEIAIYPEYDVLAAHQTKFFELQFRKIPKTTKTVDLIMGPDVKFYGIILNDKNDE